MGGVVQEQSTVNVQEKSTTNLNVVEVNAAYKTKKKVKRTVKSYKKTYAKKTTSRYTRYAKVKAVYYYRKGKRYVRYVRYYAYKTVSAASTYSVSATPVYSGVATVAAGSSEEQILRGAARFGYSSAAHDGATMERTGAGDCWAMSDYLYTKFSQAGVQSRVVQYANSYVSNHRSVQLYQNSAWLDVPYAAYGINNLFSAQSSKPGMTVIAGG
ncbi:MAG TPA: hypothetical protein VK444_06060 [Methanobacteriaceae archaeon]|nr:hypothetical protein [Methanobacteriaceae archaeon]